MITASEYRALLIRSSKRFTEVSRMNQTPAAAAMSTSVSRIALTGDFFLLRNVGSSAGAAFFPDLLPEVFVPFRPALPP